MKPDTKNQTPDQILKIYFQRKQKRFSKYSLRALARDLRISPAHVHRIMSGKRSLLFDQISDIGRCLDMDSLAVQSLQSAVLRERIPRPLDESMITKAELSSSVDKYEPLPESDYFLLTKWYYLPILDLTCCVNFVDDPEWIASRLGLESRVVEMAIIELEKRNYLRMENGRRVKATENIRFPTRKSRPVVAQFHQDMLKKTEESFRDASDEEFERRLIAGICIASDPEKVAEAKRFLYDALHKAADILGSGLATEVYYLSLSFFPFTNDETSQNTDHKTSSHWAHSVKLPEGQSFKSIRANQWLSRVTRTSDDQMMGIGDRTFKAYFWPGVRL